MSVALWQPERDGPVALLAAVSGGRAATKMEAEGVGSSPWCCRCPLTALLPTCLSSKDRNTSVFIHYISLTLTCLQRGTGRNWDPGRWDEREWYPMLHCHHGNDFSIKMGSDEGHFKAPLIVRGNITKWWLWTRTFEEKEDWKWGNKLMPSAYQLDTWTLGQTVFAKASCLLFLMLTVVNFTSYSKILIFSHPVATGADGSLQWWEELVTTEMRIYHAYSPGSFQSSDSRNGNLSCISYLPGSFPQLVTTWHQQLTAAAVEVSAPLSHLHPHPPHVGDEQSPEKCQTEVKQTLPLFSPSLFYNEQMC